MEHTVFVDKIGKIFNGDYNEAVENFERYKDFSQMGIGRFAQKNVYLLDSSNGIVKSFGSTKFEGGGNVEQKSDFIKDFILGKKIKKENLPDDFYILESSVMIYKNKEGQYPLISKSQGNVIFHKSNFSISDYITSIEKKFKEVCVLNAIKFEMK